MKAIKLYQVTDTEFKSERFCFNAKNEEDAKDKLRNWLNRHGFMRIRDQFTLSEVMKPFYDNNIHNEWVS